MVLRRLPIRALCALALLAAPALGADAPRPGEVTLPLKDYLTLADAAERAERAAQEAKARREAPAAAVTAERLTAVLGEREATLESDLEVLVQGEPREAVALPLNGLAERITVEPAGAAVAAAPDGSGLRLVATAPGRYRVRLSTRAPLAESGGVRRLPLQPVVAPVASTELDLPADLAWSSPGAVVVDERVEGGRRQVRLAAQRGQARAVELRRQLGGGQADQLLAQAVVLTIVQLRPEGPRRHDVVLYEVARGSLAALAVDLPPGLAIDQVGTEEGGVVPVVEGAHLSAQRRRQLSGVGYLVLSSTPPPGERLALAPVVPAVPVRAHYLALASSVAAETEPLPAGRWSRVDLTDLPAELSEALRAMELTAAWRLAGTPAEAPDLAVAVRPLPAATALAALIRQRETTTLATVDGTVLHRDRLTVEPSVRPSAEGTVLELQLPAGAVLWSVEVGGQPVRPLEQAGKVSIPLGADAGGPTAVEVVSVLEKAIPPGRSSLTLELAQVAAPVALHRWRLLLPERARYRFRDGDLKPAVRRLPVASGVVGGIEGGVVGGFAAPATEPSPIPAEEENRPALRDEAAGRDKKVAKSRDGERQDLPREAWKQEVDELRQGLVGGVKPLPVSIPEEGKSLLLTGVLPPQKVRVELDVRGARR